MKKNQTLEGQWIGDVIIDGAKGLAVLDVDGERDHYKGTARVFIDGEPGAVCEFVTEDLSLEQNWPKMPLHWITHDGPVLLSRADALKRYPGSDFPVATILDLKLDGDTLKASWETDLGRKGEALLYRGFADEPSQILVESINSWSEFKSFALEQPIYRYIYRGQAEAYRLRTTFHRSHRKDLVRYVSEDVPLVHKTLTTKIRHILDMDRADQQGAFYSLIQHHGYPTPLLDWTYSPFVAAFFAFRRKQRIDAPSDKVRIFLFDKETWAKDFTQVQVLNFAQPHFSIMELLAIENPRALPQQSITTLTNVDDIETYIDTREQLTKKTYLKAIDLDAGLRREVMIELSLMGITAGSLFPGLDGACEELAGRMFHP